MNSVADVLSGASIDPALTGGASQPVSPSNAAAASAPMASPNPASPPPDVMTPGMAPPDVSATQGINPAQAPPAPPPDPARPWKGILTNVLEGALNGLAGVNNVKGRGGFGAGAGAGAENELKQEQVQTQNKQAQQRLQMESVQAGDSHILALAQAKQSDLVSQKLKLEIDAQSQAAKVLNDILRIDPPASVTADNSKDMHAQATGTLPTLAAANGGQLPRIASTNSPAGVGTDPNTHTVSVYATTPANLQQNPDGNRMLVNFSRMAQGLPLISDQEWKTGGGAAFAELQKNGLTSGNALLSAVAAGQNKLVDDAKASLYVTPKISSNPDDNIAAEKTLQNSIAKFKSAPNYDPNDQQQGAALALMNQNLSLLQNGGDEAEQKAADLEAKRKALDTTADQNARKPFVQQEQAFQASLARQTAALNRQGADQNSRALKASEMTTKEANDRDTDLNSISGVSKQLDMATAGNQQAYQDAVTRFAEHEIKAGGMSRFNSTEQKALGPGVGSWARQLDTYATKGFTGKGAAPTIAEMRSVLQLETQQRTDLYNQRVGNIQQSMLNQQPTSNSNQNQMDTDFAKKYGAVIR